jgi:hypothetical protein
MISFVIYEGIDFAWHFGKLVYNITTGTYNWYYSKDNKNNDEKVHELEEIELENTIIINKLQQRIKKLENIINEKK